VRCALRSTPTGSTGTSGTARRQASSSGTTATTRCARCSTRTSRATSLSCRWGLYVCSGDARRPRALQQCAGALQECACAALRRQRVRLLHAGWLRAAGGGRQPRRRCPLCSAWRTRRCAQVGVGTSALQLDMVLDGYHSITNVDYSSVAIERMREMHKGVHGLHYVLADCRRASVWGTDSSGKQKGPTSAGLRGWVHAAGVQAHVDSLGNRACRSGSASGRCQASGATGA